jgi:hypothetical protein
MVMWARSLSKIDHPANPGHHANKLNMDIPPTSDNRQEILSAGLLPGAGNLLLDNQVMFW